MLQPHLKCSQQRHIIITFVLDQIRSNLSLTGVLEKTSGLRVSISEVCYLDVGSKKKKTKQKLVLV